MSPTLRTLGCVVCGAEAALTRRTKCPTCGGILDARYDGTPEAWRATFVAAAGDPAPGMWRWRATLPVPDHERPVHLGEGDTPLIASERPDAWGAVPGLSFKCETANPTGSFKDRPAAVALSMARAWGVPGVVTASSGNAGASVAAYAARAGMEAHVFVPAYASPDKRAQIGVYGAQIEAVPGSREEAKREAIQTAAKEGVAYASHAYHPCFLLGQETVAWELWEQLDGKAPDWYVVPVGQGVHLLGMWLGFRRLRRAGLVDRIPRLVGVQAALLAPVCEAFEAGLEDVPGLELTSPTLAEGLAIPKPIRGQRVLEAIRSSGGNCVSVSEEQISAARREAALQGFYIEPTSATALAAVEIVHQMAAPEDVIVVPLTGSGLKGSPTVD